MTEFWTGPAVTYPHANHAHCSFRTMATAQLLSTYPTGDAGRRREKSHSWKPQLSLTRDNPTTYFPPSAAVTGQISSTILMQLTQLFHCITSALTLTNLANLKMETVRSSETSVHFSTTSRTNANKTTAWPKNLVVARKRTRINRECNAFAGDTSCCQHCDKNEVCSPPKESLKGHRGVRYWCWATAAGARSWPCMLTQYRSGQV
jgi:hypothetical protein